MARLNGVATGESHQSRFSFKGQTVIYRSLQLLCLAATALPKFNPEIPDHIGVLIYRAFDQRALELAPQPLRTLDLLSLRKPNAKTYKSSKRPLSSHFITSLFREVDKAKRVERTTALL